MVRGDVGFGGHPEAEAAGLGGGLGDGFEGLGGGEIAEGLDLGGAGGGAVEEAGDEGDAGVGGGKLEGVFGDGFSAAGLVLGGGCGGGEDLAEEFFGFLCGIGEEDEGLFVGWAGEGAEGHFGDDAEAAGAADHEAGGAVTGDVFHGASAAFDEGA